MLTELLVRCTDHKSTLEVLEELRSDLWEMIGEASQREISEVARLFGDPRREAFAKRNVVELWKCIQFHKQQIDNTDVPANIGGKP